MWISQKKHEELKNRVESLEGELRELRELRDIKSILYNAGIIQYRFTGFNAKIVAGFQVVERIVELERVLGKKWVEVPAKSGYVDVPPEAGA